MILPNKIACSCPTKYGWHFVYPYYLRNILAVKPQRLKASDFLHELHNDFPLAPEKLTVSNDMLSKYCKKIGDKYEIKVGDVKKLIPNLGNKTNYIVHYRNLQLYLS